MQERYVLLGLARARSVWFREVARWATSAAIPAEFVKCVSAEELRAQLAAGRPFSAVLLDAGLPAVDRDLLAAAREAGSPALVVRDARVDRDWIALGASAILPADLDRRQLLDALAAHGRTVGGVQSYGGVDQLGVEDTPQGAVVTVTGPGGTGASTAAIALAQALARDERHVGRVLLADLCLAAEQAVLHDARDVVPGVQELIEAHRGRQPGRDELDALTFDVPERGYRLLLGLRRRRYWPAVRPRAFEAAFASLRRVYGTVVCDVTPDVEGEEQSGSADVEERNVMARTAVLAAEAVLVVGAPSAKGVHALVRLMGELRDVGVPAERLVPVVSSAPRNPRARAEIAAAVTRLAVTEGRDAAGLAAPVFLPEKPVDAALRDGVALPAPLGPVLLGAYRGTLGRRAPAAPTAADGAPVTPGSLGVAVGTPRA